MSVKIYPGEFRHKIQIVRRTKTEGTKGIKTSSDTVLLTTRAKIRTTKGYTLIKSGTDFEEAHTNFTIRYPRSTTITRRDIVLYNGREFAIDYANNVNEEDRLLELQAKAVTHGKI